MADDDLILIRMRLQDARKVMEEAKGVAGAVKKIGQEADHTGAAVGRGNRANFAYTQGLYTLRRGAFWATTGMIGLGTAAVVMGFKFNASMESNQLVMAQFLGSAQAARRELGSLFQLAATGPFEFTNLVSAARQFLAFGFGLKETNKDLRILSDTAAGLQLGGAGIEHLVMVFGQIRASGRLLGQDMLQLQQAGINVRGILQRELGLSKAQMTALAQGTLSIPSEVAIPAIMAGLNRTPQQGGFRGLSQRLQGTFTALTATAHDYASQLFGTITHPWFLDAERGLRRLNPLLLAAGRAYKQGGMDALFQTLDRGLGANGRLIESWREVRAVGQDIDRIVRGALIPAFGVLWATIGLGSPPMKLLIGLLGFVAQHTTALKIGLIALAAWFLYTRTATLLYRTAVRAAGTDVAVLTATTKTGIATQKLNALWTYRNETAYVTATRAVGRYRGALLGLRALGVISVAVVLDEFTNHLPQAPRQGGHGAAARTEHGIRSIPAVGDIFGFGEWLGNKTVNALDGRLGGDRHAGGQSTRGSAADAVAKAVADRLQIQSTDIFIGKDKVGSVAFEMKAKTKGRNQ